MTGHHSQDIRVFFLLSSIGARNCNGPLRQEWEPWNKYPEPSSSLGATKTAEEDFDHGVINQSQWQPKKGTFLWRSAITFQQRRALKHSFITLKHSHALIIADINMPTPSHHQQIDVGHLRPVKSGGLFPRMVYSWIWGWTDGRMDGCCSRTSHCLLERMLVFY